MFLINVYIHSMYTFFTFCFFMYTYCIFSFFMYTYCIFSFFLLKDNVLSSIYKVSYKVHD